MGDTVIVETPIDEVVSIVTAGPQGPSGSEAATLTTTGDLLYRDALANDRLPIGSEGQVLKVSSGLPAWGNESGAVTSVNGETGTVVLDAADVGAQAQLQRTSVVVSADTVLSSNQNQQINLVVYGNVVANVTLPYENRQNGDLLTITTEFFGSPSITLRKIISISPLIYQTERVLQTSGEKYQFIVNQTSWTALTVVTHTHPASDITSGTLAHERGGLEADVSAYDGLVKISGGSTSAVTVTTAGEALLDDADAAAQRTTLGLGNSATLDTGTTAGTVAEGDHTHELNALDATGITAGKILTADGDNTASWQDAPAGGIGGSTGSTDNAILRADGTGGSTAQAADLVIDDATTSTQNNVAIANNHSETNSALVLTPKGTGAFIVGPKPDGTATGGNARGNYAVCIQPERSSAGHVGSGSHAVAIGTRIQCAATDCVAIGRNITNAAQNSVAIGQGAVTNSGNNATAIGGINTTARGTGSVALGGSNITADFRAQFVVLPFSAVYWGGSTTNATPTILNLDATATNRFTIAANTALAVDVLLVARRSDTADKWLVAHRFLGIRRDGSNNTSLIGSVQTLGTDQSDGSPAWSFTLTADDTNEALQLEVTGAASETVQWRATAFYRVV